MDFVAVVGAAERLPDRLPLQAKLPLHLAVAWPTEHLALQATLQLLPPVRATQSAWWATPSAWHLERPTQTAFRLGQATDYSFHAPTPQANAVVYNHVQQHLTVVLMLRYLMIFPLY